MFFRTIAVCCFQLMQQPDGGTEEDREMLLEGKNAVLRGGMGDRRRRRRLGPSCYQDDAKNKAKNYDKGGKRWPTQRWVGCRIERRGFP